MLRQFIRDSEHDNFITYLEVKPGIHLLVRRYGRLLCPCTPFQKMFTRNPLVDFYIQTLGVGHPIDLFYLLSNEFSFHLCEKNGVRISLNLEAKQAG